MKRFVCILSCVAMICATAFGEAETLTTFSYTQTDVMSGSGTIAAPPSSSFNGVNITWTDTAMPQAGVRDPGAGGAADGYVGTFNQQNGAEGPNGFDVALHWNKVAPDRANAPDPVIVDITGSGDDGKSYTMSVPLVFWGDPTNADTSYEIDLEGVDVGRVADDVLLEARTELGLPAPDPAWGTNDYKWELEFGRAPAPLNPDITNDLATDVIVAPRTAMWFSPTWAGGEPVDYDGDGVSDTGGRAQRYTQVEFGFTDDLYASGLIPGETFLSRDIADLDGDGVEDLNVVGSYERGIASGAEKDASDRDGLNANDRAQCATKPDLDDNGLGDCTAAIGLPLEFGFGWRDRDDEGNNLFDPQVFIDNYKVEGILFYDESTIVVGGGGGGPVCDLDGDGDCDNADIDVLYSNDGEINQWLSDASTIDNPANPGAAKTYVVGDVDLSGEVTSADLGLLLNNFGGTDGQATRWIGGDLNDSGDVTSSDLGLLLNNFGFASAASASAVPEPSGSVLLLAFAGMMLAVGRRSR